VSGVVLGARADAGDAQEVEELVARTRGVGVEVGGEVLGHGDRERRVARRCTAPER
jgi:hypothetical protein